MHAAFFATRLTWRDVAVVAKPARAGQRPWTDAEAPYGNGLRPTGQPIAPPRKNRKPGEHIGYLSGLSDVRRPEFALPSLQVSRNALSFLALGRLDGVREPA